MKLLNTAKKITTAAAALALFHRVNFAVCRRGQILHLTGVRSRCRALT